MIVIKPPAETLVGSPGWEYERGVSETQHWVRIGRDFSVSATEITVAQFAQFLADPDVKKRYYGKHPFRYPEAYAPDSGCPQIAVRWYEGTACGRVTFRVIGRKEDSRSLTISSRVRCSDRSVLIRGWFS